MISKCEVSAKTVCPFLQDKWFWWVDLDDYRYAYGESSSYENALGEMGEALKRLDSRREEIVLCRDCKHFREERRDSSIGWVDGFVCVSEQWSTSSLMPNHKVEPDGFCKWAERREEGDAE